MSQTASAPLMEDEHVKELLTILHENGKEADSLIDMLKYVGSMEQQLNTAVGELQAILRGG